MASLMQNRGLRQSRAAFLADETQGMFDTGDIRGADALAADAPLTVRPDAQRMWSITAGLTHEVALMAPGRHGALIFASGTKPGGGWRNGAIAQEEDVCMHGTWGLQAEHAGPGFYGDEATAGLGPDAVLMAEGAWLIHPNQFALGGPVSVVFGAVAAPNRHHSAVRDLPSEALEEVLARRLRTAFDAWADRDVPTVVAGAIGCGVFCWAGDASARALIRGLVHSRWGGRLILAMPDPVLAATFSKALTEAFGPATKLR